MSVIGRELSTSARNAVLLNIKDYKRRNLGGEWRNNQEKKYVLEELSNAMFELAKEIKNEANSITISNF